MKLSEQFNAVYDELKTYKVPFVIVFFVIVLLTYGILYAIDFIPEPVDAIDQSQQLQNEIANVTQEEPILTEEETVVIAPYPEKIIFDSLDKEITVLNPESRLVADLDTALLSGAVRHPDSATFEEEGNIFILGHSSYLPTVFNKNFQAFNGIQDLTWGDIIRLQSEDVEYIYRVQKVYKAKASEVFVPDTPGKAQLTLATCNSFGSKDDRFMVEATLIDTKQL